MFLLNVAVRYATDRHIIGIARSCRQCAPLIATAESLSFIAGDDIDPIVSPLRTDVAGARQAEADLALGEWRSIHAVRQSASAAILLSDFVAAVYEYLNLAFLLDATGRVFCREGSLSPREFAPPGNSRRRRCGRCAQRRVIPRGSPRLDDARISWSGGGY